MMETRIWRMLLIGADLLKIRKNPPDPPDPCSNPAMFVTLCNLSLANCSLAKSLTGVNKSRFSKISLCIGRFPFIQGQIFLFRN